MRGTITFCIVLCVIWLRLFQFLRVTLIIWRKFENGLFLLLTKKGDLTLMAIALARLFILSRYPATHASTARGVVWGALYFWGAILRELQQLWPSWCNLGLLVSGNPLLRKVHSNTGAHAITYIDVLFFSHPLKNIFVVIGQKFVHFFL